MDSNIKRVRTKLTLREKYEIIKEIESGKEREDVRKQHNLKYRSSVKSIWDNREKIKNDYESKSEKNRKIYLYVRGSNYPDIEEALILWMRQIRAKKSPCR